MAKGNSRHPTVNALESLAARMIEPLPDHQTAKSIQGAINRLYRGAEALDAVARNRSPLDTPAAHALKVAKLAKRLDSEITSTLNTVGQTWGAGFNDAQRRIDEKVKLIPDPFASEIREVFRGLEPAKKGEFIQRLVNENRGPELAALIKAPTVLTGLGDREREGYEKAIYSRHAAAELDEQTALEEVFHTANVACKSAGEFVKALQDPGQIAQIEHEAAQADAAGDAFNQAMQ